MDAIQSSTAELTIESQPEPKSIRRLQDEVINRIAAGEIIHRPASALKELLENCLDAGATSIRVTVRDGGMKLLQIQDNGCGIKKPDLPILAHRFTTSKLSKFSDLSHLTTYGFRGEALASISHVANLTVVTKTKKESCAWKAIYVDGQMTPSQKGASVDPKPCAGNDGTTITVENLFYNVPARLSALRTSSEEYARILDVITKYAVHNAGVSFLCKKVGISTPDLSTPSSTTKQAIRLLYGQAVAKDLLTAEISSPKKGKRKRDTGEDQPRASNYDEDGWTAQAHFTNANYHSKKFALLLFINNRLVESSRIKKALEACYTAILPKGTSPFIYLSIQLDPTTVDVNVHPTKREVHFLEEEAITECIADAIQAKLAQSGERTFEYQTLLTGGIAAEGASAASKGKEKAHENNTGSDSASSTPPPPPPSAPSAKKILSQHKVRTSAADRTLDSMFLPSSSQPGDPDDTTARQGTDAVKERRKTREIPQSTCYLTSVLTLRENVKKAKHVELTEILQKHVFVGVVDLDRDLSVLQFLKKLYLVNHGALAEELFYQLGLRQFGNFPRLKLDPPAPLRALITLAVDTEENTELSNLTKPQIVDSIAHILISRREMLREYFSLGITIDGMVDSLPALIPDLTPNLDKLPLFFMRLGPQVNWNSEQDCFDTFLRELAYFYVPGPGPLATPSPPRHSADDGTDKDGHTNAQREEAPEKWQIEHVLFPAMKRYLTAPKSLLTRDVVQIASLPDLYRVFERC